MALRGPKSIMSPKISQHVGTEISTPHRILTHSVKAQGQTVGRTSADLQASGPSSRSFLMVNCTASGFLIRYRLPRL